MVGGGEELEEGFEEDETIHDQEARVWAYSATKVMRS